MGKNDKVKVSRRAVEARINRKLLAEGEILRKTRADSRAWFDLGEYYSIDVSRGFICRRDCDLEQLAREVGALKSWEVVREV